jgi:hypothetical protein
MKIFIRIFVYVLGAAIAAAVATVGLDGTKRDQTGIIKTAGPLAISAVQVGDCVNKPPAGEAFDRVKGIPCSESHYFEVIEVTDLDSETDYKTSKMNLQVEGICKSAFKSYVGVDWDKSRLAMTYAYPTKQSWEHGDRNIQCLIARSDGFASVGSFYASKK